MNNMIDGSSGVDRDDRVDAKHALLMARVPDDGSAALVMTVLSTARMIDQACARMLSPHGLSEGRFAALLAVEAQDGASPSAIADSLGVTRATVTGLLEGLERSGLVTRAVDAADRRSHTVSLTSAGVALVAELIPVYSNWLGYLAAGVAGRVEVVDALTQVQANLRESTAVEADPW